MGLSPKSKKSSEQEEVVPKTRLDIPLQRHRCIHTQKVLYYHAHTSDNTHYLENSVVWHAGDEGGDKESSRGVCGTENDAINEFIAGKVWNW